MGFVFIVLVSPKLLIPAISQPDPMAVYSCPPPIELSRGKFKIQMCPLNIATRTPDKLPTL